MALQLSLSMVVLSSLMLAVVSAGAAAAIANVTTTITTTITTTFTTTAAVTSTGTITTTAAAATAGTNTTTAASTTTDTITTTAAVAGATPVCSYGNCSGQHGLPGCGTDGRSTLERWREDFSAGDRLSFVVRYSCADLAECNDNSLFGKMSANLRCLVKGPSGRGSLEMAAYTDANMCNSRIEIHTKRPCGFYMIRGLHSGAAGLSVPGAAASTTAADLRWELAEFNASEEEEGDGSGSGEDADAESNTCTNADQLLEFYTGSVDPARQIDPSCPYMPLPEGEDIVRKPPSSWPEGRKWFWNYQASYLGPVYEVEYVNGEYPGSPQYDASEEVEEYFINFGAASMEVASGCDDAEALRSGNSDASGAFYDGGVHIRSTRGSYLTRRMYQFKNDAQRDAAMAAANADSTGMTNPGLMYAHLVAGMSGCDVEMVFEVKPKLGGGLEMHFSFPLFAFTTERQTQLRESSVVWISGAAGDAHGEALHYGVTQRALQHAQNLPCASAQPEDAFVEMGVFALTFVCWATGERVIATAEMQMANGSWIATSALSRSQLEPTHWRDEAAAPEQHGPEYPRFRLALTAVQAPESCGVMFFDPLLVPPSGDGLLYSSDSKEPSDWVENTISDCSSCHGGCLVAGICYRKHPSTGQDVTRGMCQAEAGATWCGDAAVSSTTTSLELGSAGSTSEAPASVGRSSTLPSDTSTSESSIAGTTSVDISTTASMTTTTWSSHPDLADTTSSARVSVTFDLGLAMVLYLMACS